MAVFPLHQVEALVVESGYTNLGWLTPAREELPGLSSDVSGPLSLLLIGNAGDLMWQRFSAEAVDFDHSMDQWCLEKIQGIADQCQAKAMFPFEKPHLPFQRWAVRTGAFFTSPLGLTIHEEFGLWHAFRGALLFDREMNWPVSSGQTSPCEACKDRPCLSSCPVGAFSGDGYDVPVCVGNITTGDEKRCSMRGCAARRACPVGGGYQYSTDQATFHMDAFKRTFG